MDTNNTTVHDLADTFSSIQSAVNRQVLTEEESAILSKLVFKKYVNKELDQSKLSAIANLCK